MFCAIYYNGSNVAVASENVTPALLPWFLFCTFSFSGSVCFSSTLWIISCPWRDESQCSLLVASKSQLILFVTASWRAAVPRPPPITLKVCIVWLLPILTLTLQFVPYRPLVQIAFGSCYFLIFLGAWLFIGRLRFRARFI